VTFLDSDKAPLYQQLGDFLSVDEKQKPLKIEVLDKISTLITAAFAFIAAFAWNETIKVLVYEKLSDEAAPFVIIGYAVMITILAVIVTVMVARAIGKAKSKLQ